MQLLVIFKYIMYLETKACSSPLTKDGLEITSSVTVELGVESKDTFLLLNEHIKKNYIFDKSCDDDSASILEEINKMLNKDDADSDAIK